MQEESDRSSDKKILTEENVEYLGLSTTQVALGILLGFGTLIGAIYNFSKEKSTSNKIQNVPVKTGGETGYVVKQILMTPDKNIDESLLTSSQMMRTQANNKTDTIEIETGSRHQQNSSPKISWENNASNIQKFVLGGSVIFAIGSLIKKYLPQASLSKEAIVKNEQQVQERLEEDKINLVEGSSEYKIYPFKAFDIHGVDKKLHDDLKEVLSYSVNRLDSAHSALISREEYFLETIEDYCKSAETNSFNKHLNSLLDIRNANIEKARNKEERPTVIVVGAGPGGLIAAFEAYEAGASQVVLVEKRTEYSRDTMFRLNENTTNYLRALLGHIFVIAETHEIVFEKLQNEVDIEIFNENRFLTVETRHLEYMLYTLLKNLAKRDGKDLTLHRGWEFIQATEPQCEADSWKIRIKNSNEELKDISTDWLIGFDGINSSVRKAFNIEWTPKSTSTSSGVITFPNIFVENIVLRDLDFFVPETIVKAKKSLNKKPKQLKTTNGREFFVPRDEQVKIAANIPKKGIRESLQIIDKLNLTEPEQQQSKARFFTSRTNLYYGDKHEKKIDEQIIITELELANVGAAELKQELSELGWAKERLPINRLFNSAFTIYLGTDIPDSMYDEMKKENALDVNDRKIQLAWFKKVIEANFPSALINILMSRVRQTSIFKSELFQAETSIQVKVSHEKKLHVSLGGDAQEVPQFQTGSGAAKAIEDGRRIGTLLQANMQLSEDRFDEACKNYRSETNQAAIDLQEKAFTLGVVQKLE